MSRRSSGPTIWHVAVARVFDAENGRRTELIIHTPRGTKWLRLRLSRGACPLATSTETIRQFIHALPHKLRPDVLITRDEDFAASLRTIARSIRAIVRTRVWVEPLEAARAARHREGPTLVHWYEVGDATPPPLPVSRAA